MNTDCWFGINKLELSEKYSF